MEKTKFERGKSLTYPHYFPTLTFTPIFGRRGDFVWVEEVKGAWPEYDSEFTFVRSTVHDQRVDSLKAENAKLRDERDLYSGLVEIMDHPDLNTQLKTENEKLLGLLATALGQVQEMCEANKDRCATCPLHHGHDECLMVAAQNDARDAGVGVITYEGKVERKCSRR